MGKKPFIMITVSKLWEGALKMPLHLKLANKSSGKLGAHKHRRQGQVTKR